jgi:hypothetical protein
MGRLASSLRRQLLGTRCGDDTHHKDEGDTTNVDARLICSHRKHLEVQKGSVSTIIFLNNLTLSSRVAKTTRDLTTDHGSHKFTRVTLEPLRGPSLR